MTKEEVALWWLEVTKTSNEAFLPLFFDEHRFLVLKGGAGSGKSIFCGRKLIERAFAEPGHRFLICRKVGNTLRESCWRNILMQLAEYYPGRYKPNKSDLYITCDTGSVFLFAGLDDVEKMKSIVDVTGIWIEEASELLEKDLTQLNIRMRGETKYYKQIMLSFNPISITHWLKKKFFDEEDPDVRTHETTYHDNRFLTDEDRQVLEKLKRDDRYHYEVYCLGMWGTTGQSVFDGEAVTRRLLENVQPLRVGDLAYEYDGLSISEIKFEDNEKGAIRIFQEPEAGVPYVIGGDTAGDGSDSFVGFVIDNRTGQEVAILKQKYDEDQYARQMYCLGMYYNTALVGIETNWSTYPVMELDRLNYPNQYVRERVDEYTHKTEKRYGFVTTSKTRPIIISELIQAVRDDINVICDKDTLTEMLTFVRNEDYRPEAEEGAHDDCIMAAAIAHHIRPQQSYLQAKEHKRVKWTDSQWEDYHNATPEIQRKLKQMWGEPL